MAVAATFSIAPYANEDYQNRSECCGRGPNIRSPPLDDICHQEREQEREDDDSSQSG